MSGDAAARHLYLLAFPAGHSVSPQMHSAAFRHLGLDISYRALAVPPAELAGTLASLAAQPRFLGANVTVPHKEAVAALVEHLTPAAQAIGAVNTVYLQGGRLAGDNTDASGFLRSLEEAGCDPSGVDAVLLGAGGSARAVAAALLGVGASVRVANRSPGRALALAKVADAWAGAGLVAPGGGLAAVSEHELDAVLASCRLLVNCTSVGMSGGPQAEAVPLGVDVASLPRDAVVVDLVYRPLETPLMAAARAAGRRTVTGIGMLVHQGAAAFEIWTGRSAPVEVMRNAAMSGVS